MAGVTVKGILIPEVKKTAKNTKENWQSGITQLKNGGILGKGFSAFSEGVVGTAANQVKTVKNIAENPSGFLLGMLNSRIDAISKNHC